MVKQRKCPAVHSKQKKKTNSGGSQEFPSGYCGKLLFHLTFNQNSQMFWLNGKTPYVLSCSKS